MATMRYRWGHRGYVAIGVVAVAIAAAWGYRGETFEAVVVRIVDGDTIAIDGDAGELMLRLWGVDAPEMDQVWGFDAQFAAGRLCMGELVRIEVVDVDRYKRRVVKVRLPDGRDLADELVREGNAWWSSKYAPRDETKKRLHDAARAGKIGLWSRPPCQSPADHRRAR